MSKLEKSGISLGTFSNATIIDNQTLLARFRSCQTWTCKILHTFLISWFMWLARNKAKFDGVKINSDSVIMRIMNLLCITHQAKSFERFQWAGDLRIAFD